MSYISFNYPTHIENHMVLGEDYEDDDEIDLGEDDDEFYK